MISTGQIIAAGAITALLVAVGAAATRWRQQWILASASGSLVLITAWRALSNLLGLNSDFVPAISVGDAQPTTPTESREVRWLAPLRGRVDFGSAGQVGPAIVDGGSHVLLYPPVNSTDHRRAAQRPSHTGRCRPCSPSRSMSRSRASRPPPGRRRRRSAPARHSVEWPSREHETLRHWANRFLENFANEVAN